MNYSGVSGLSLGRRARSLAGTPVTVSLGGTVIATGTLDANGQATLVFTSASVPQGSTVQISAGPITVTVTLATSSTTTVVTIKQNTDGTISVTAGSPQNPNDQNSTQNSSGSITVIDNSNATVLPVNLPITVAATCTTITLTPNSPSITRLQFYEKGSDSSADGSAMLTYDGPFTGALQFPVISGSERVHIIVWAGNQKLLEIIAPLMVISGIGGAAPPSGCPTPVPTPTPSPRPSETVFPCPSAPPGSEIAVCPSPPIPIPLPSGSPFPIPSFTVFPCPTPSGHDTVVPCPIATSIPTPAPTPTVTRS
ncbi:MAG: hypothetical protein JO101_08035 [Candidatus Eremiobacteraeota bacterium]|nr:hypothetical protein [Candidatus Eremiobacteraeota bacterium]MBV8355252.1 hypothetical protein [Candidatus Eremiobacteraeota bacterium]